MMPQGSLQRPISVVVVALLGFAATLANGAEATWPRRLDTERGQLTIYQPQPEKFDGNTLTGRAAASLKATGQRDPTFGVFWFTARVDTDREAGTAVLRDILVTNVRWPESTEENERVVGEFLTRLMPQTSVPIHLEQLKASLATAELEQKSLEGLKHDPPKIVFVEELAELLLYDGEPRSITIPDTQFEHVANSSFAVVKDTSDGTYYLSGGRFWYSAKDPKGPWESISGAPLEVIKLMPPVETTGPTPDKPPKIVVATEPTELIATDGVPSWRPIGNGDLLYVANTETPVVREVASGNVFVLISGRWYTAGTFAGPWTVVRPDQMPAAFKDIPPDSDLAAARVSVAGTPEANDAMLDAYVPQTAAIERSKASLEVTYDGEPRFQQIEGTQVWQAVNTATQVLRVDGKFYACDEAVWFVADAATGPWAVADRIPKEAIDQIPPSEPVYNLTHVEVYDSTPEVVYVGYTPGYVWSYPWWGVPIYGTGWPYPPYWGVCCYYPRPVTYGVHVTYNPYTGWGMGFSYSFGFLTVGIAFGGGYGGYYRPGYPPPIYYRPPAYYPPGGYRPPGYPPNHRPGQPRPTPYAGGGRPSAGQLPAGGGRPSAGQLPAGSNNLYSNAANRDRVAPSSGQRSNLQSVDRSARGANNVYGDSAGNVHRQTSQGWESRSSQGQWQSSPSQTPSNLNRDYAARQSGASASRSMGGMSRGGGGGMRRR
jgi:hypothetical protein